MNKKKAPELKVFVVWQGRQGLFCVTESMEIQQRHKLCVMGAQRKQLIEPRVYRKGLIWSHLSWSLKDE